MEATGNWEFAQEAYIGVYVCWPKRREAPSAPSLFGQAGMSNFAQGVHPVTENPISTYFEAIEQDRRTGMATEHTYRPALKDLFQSLERTISAINEPRRVECGAPDYAVSRKLPQGPVTIGYVEAKDIGTSLDAVESSEQLERYLSALDNLVLTDYLEFRWYVGGHRQLTARLANSRRDGRISILPSGPHEVEDLLRSFVGHSPPPITRPRELAERMARLSRQICYMIEREFERDEASSLLRDLRQAVTEILIPDLSATDFADLFAQTLAYGLFAARVNHSPSAGRFQRLGAAADIPKTNPFLRKLFAAITGPDLDDELFACFVDDLAVLLAETDIAAVLADFGRRTRREDPVVHFYETFLSEYDPEMREARGVYYTPEPVVSFITRSVDKLLKSRLGCRDGLADGSVTSYTQIRDGIARGAQTHRVLILDPACGTGTFLYSVVDQVRETFIGRADAGKWPGYVRDHLLPRLFGFELLLAPYAVAHLKMAMQLAAQDLPESLRSDWAYDFGSGDRLGIYLTNTLEQALKRSDLLMGGFISDEANSAGEVKNELPIMVVLGNPPYSNFGMMNRGKWILDLLKDYKTDLNERKLNLDDDFIKFIRFGQWRIDRSGAGVLALVTNHSYIDGITHRRMRQSLMNTFTEVYILDLHGSSRKVERVPGGGIDQNVFDIQQGVAIAIFVKEPGREGPANVYHAEFWGPRNTKYDRLSNSDVEDTSWVQLNPEPDYFFFVPKQFSRDSQWQSYIPLPALFPTHSTGIKTHLDDVFVGKTDNAVRANIRSYIEDNWRDVNPRLARRGSPLRKAWLLKEFTRRDPGLALHDYSYRAFDRRRIAYLQSAIEAGDHRFPVMKHVLRGSPLLLTTRQLSQDTFEHVFTTDALTDMCVLSTATKECAYCFPLYLYPDPMEHGTTPRAEILDASPWAAGSNGRRPNLAPEYVSKLEEQLSLSFVHDGRGDMTSTFGPEDLFHFVYAVLHSPAYRASFADFLKIEFPRVPLNVDKDLFCALARKGLELLDIHLMRSSLLSRSITHYPIPGPNVVEPGFPHFIAMGEPDPTDGVQLDEGRVYINRSERTTGKRGQYFGGVPSEVWDFRIGGYQVCDKWLKERRGTVLSSGDLAHYEKIVVAVNETIRLMGEIDVLVPVWDLN